MSRPSLSVALLTLLCLTACGGASSSSQGTSVSSVAVQSSDLPSGMTRCDLTGDLDSFIKTEATPDPSTSKTISQEWAQAKSKGATAAYAAIYSDSSAHCSEIKNSGSPGAATYKLVVNFVVQFKDEKTAAKSYSSDSILGFSASSLRSANVAAITGTQTGLSANSIAVTEPVAGQLYYIAVWQNKTFVVILAVLNVDAASAKKVATSENGRIK
jgi:hypothetical protein